MSPTPLPHRLRLLICLLKGGAGKTTSTWYLGRAFAKLGYRVVLVDADLGSRSLSSWYVRCGGEGYVPFFVRIWEGSEKDGQLSVFLKRLENELDPDIVIVDTGGERREVFMSACLWADRLLLPTGPSTMELERVHETKEHAEEVAQVSPLAVSVLLTRVSPPRKGLAADARALVQREDEDVTNDYRPYALHVMQTEISNNRHRYSVGFGTVSDDAGEYTDLALELLAELLTKQNEEVATA